jgi:Acyl-CoA dehydrogenase, middle domain
MATGEQVWAQAWSEPGAGSDLAAIRSAATRTDGGWLLTGQKTWSPRAALWRCYRPHQSAHWLAVFHIQSAWRGHASSVSTTSGGPPDSADVAYLPR